MTLKWFLAFVISVLSPSIQAAEATSNMAALGLYWALPFAGVLLSIALLPLLAPTLWHQHFGKIAAAWTAAFIIPATIQWGVGEAAHIVVHALLAEYIPFIILVASLYIISGGIYVSGNLHGSPKVNTSILAIGTLLASIMGTTGAAMLLVRPLLRANDNRVHKSHVFVFFIFLVANIGGSLTPLGDPPLFLGFLQGVPFFWTVGHIGPETLVCAVILLGLFYAIDSHYYHNREEDQPAIMDDTPDTKSIGFDGKMNFVWLAGAIGLVLLSGVWKNAPTWMIFGTGVKASSIVRDVGLLLMALLSLYATPKTPRIKNHFSMHPIAEVAKLFFAIFITIAPVIGMLQVGAHGAFANLIPMVHDAAGAPLPSHYFWATGLLSGFLDNAPTYLVFFNLAGGDVIQLTGTLASTLAAISAGSVFMGALTYIGNAPNFMVKAVAEHGGVKMPSFFAYMGWSFGILMPLFGLVTWIFF